MQKPKVGITIGDINGIGPEVIIKCLDDKRILDFCQPIIYGSSKVIAYHKNIVKPREFSFQMVHTGNKARDNAISLVNCWDENTNINLGEANQEGGKYAYIALDRAMNEIKANMIDAIVTAPIHKSAMQMAGFKYTGHTEYISAQVDSKKSLMMMVHDNIRVALATNHLSIGAVKEAITPDLIEQKLRTLIASLKRDFGIENPVIATLGLNPHAGDGGVIGKEDDDIIRPVIEKLKNEKLLVNGPFPADGFFGSNAFRKYDAILAMYHDQGLIPFKLLSFGNGVNYTAGLSIVRTSVDHGTGFDIVGRNIASPSSMRQALYTAIDIVRSRQNYDETYHNKLEVRSDKGVGPT